MSNRLDGKLKKLSQYTLPKRLMFFDTEAPFKETSNERGIFEFELGVAIFHEIDKEVRTKNREVIVFSEKEKMLEFINDKIRAKETLYIFAHNIAFDMRVLNLFSQLIDDNWISEPPILNNLVFIWSLKKDNYKIIFLDTANFGVQTVKDLGSDLGFPKLEIDFDTATKEELETYAIRDTEILEKFILTYISFLHTHKLGRFNITLAAQALTAFRTKFYNEDIYIHSHLGATNLERDSYYGGRTEIFRYGYLGENEYFMLDVNSMYPNAMKNYDIPIKLLGYGEDVKIEVLEDMLKKYYVIADISLETKTNAFPLRLINNPKSPYYLKNPQNLIYPPQKTNRIIFPIGRFRTVLHHEEIKLLLKVGKVHQIHRLSFYEKGNPFNDYVDFFYKYKREYKELDNLSFRYITKLFLNSLYGKFGQTEPHRDFIGLDTENRFYRIPYFNANEGVYAQELTWDYRVYKEFKKGETSFSYPAIAGAITSNARIHLFSLFEIAGFSNVFYCDTDSLITNREGYENLLELIDSSKLGLLDLQKKGKRLIIRGNKDYRLDNKLVHKGVSKTAIKDGSNSWRYLQFEGFISAWKSEMLGIMRGSYKRKSRRTDYQKGIINLDNSISPYILIEF